MSTELSLLAGHLELRPGASEPIACTRPMVGAAMMRRLTEGRRASLLPDLLGTVFTLCADVQRSTSRRAVRAALGLADDAEARVSEGQSLALYTAREHLQRLALDLPCRTGTEALDALWLRDAPVFALPSRSGGAGQAALRDAAAALPSWLERRVLGMPAPAWLQRWQAAPASWLAEWSESHPHPLARWLAGVREQAQAVVLPCRPLALLDEGESGLRALAQALGDEPGFAERPHWNGAAAETGPWTRQGRSVSATPALSLWYRLGARLADLLHLASPISLSDGQGLAFGALRLGVGEGIAWSEMSRGLLLHWVRLEAGPLHADSARAASYRVLAPTEWNFHPQGALAEGLRTGRLDAGQAALAAAVLDPCIAFEVAAERPHA